MARPMKQGLDYFPLDVDFFRDLKIRKLKRSQGTRAPLVIICLLGYIYRDDGYFLRWDKDVASLVAEELGFSDGMVTNIVEEAVSVGLFDSVMYEKYSILTSRGIQRRYFRAVMDAKRKGVRCNGDFLLISINSGINRVNSGINPQRKEKERKEKENKEDESMTRPVGPSSCPRCGKEMIRRINRDTGETFWGHRDYRPDECRASYPSLEEIDREWKAKRRNKEKEEKSREKESAAWRSVLDEQQRLFAKEKKGESGTNE